MYVQLIVSTQVIYIANTQKIYSGAIDLYAFLHIFLII